MSGEIEKVPDHEQEVVVRNPEDVFWSTPAPLTSPDFQLLHSELVRRLREESTGADTSEGMIVERLAFWYMWMRERENRKGFVPDVIYQRAMTYWGAALVELRKSRALPRDEEDIRSTTLDAVSKIVADVLSTLPSDVSEPLLSKFMTAFSTADL